MNVGGYDTVIALPWEPADRDRVLRFLRNVWPDGLYEDACGPYVGRLSEALRFAPPSREFFVYLSPEAWTAWEADGASATNRDTMLHVLGGDEEITLVVDRAHGPLDELLEELRHALLRNRDIPAIREAA